MTGIDREDLYLKQARWAAARFHLKEHVRFEKRQVYELAWERRRFDLVIFIDVVSGLPWWIAARVAVLQSDGVKRGPACRPQASLEDSHGAVCRD